MGMLEYIMLTIIIMAIIIVLIFFLTTWQVTQLSQEKSKTITTQALSLTKLVSNSPYFVKSDSMFDDTKLTALAIIDDYCKELEPILGRGWFIEINITGSSGELSDKECNLLRNYPDCGHWIFDCPGVGDNFDAFVLPVNIYRNTGRVMESGILPIVDIGTLTAGVYHG
jgi:hypothetical protein